jgi:hypothetical protein
VYYLNDSFSFQSEDYIFVELNVFEAPDRFTIDGGNSFINATVGGIDPSTAKNGDWEWDNANNKIKFIGMKFQYIIIV